MSAFLQVSDFHGATKLEPLFSEFSQMATGIEINNLVATPMGWQAIEDIRVGDDVLTFDNGTQRVVEIEHSFHDSDPYIDSPAQWPLIVPAGALGNSREIILVPNQMVMIENDASEQLLGDPFVLVRADDLIGWNGIHRYIPDTHLLLVRLRFEQEQIVIGSHDMLYHCGTKDDATLPELDISYLPLNPKQVSYLLDSAHSQRHAKALNIEPHIAADSTIVEG